MKYILVPLGIVIGIASVVGAVYLGVWIMLVGGIVQVIEAAKLTPVDSAGIAIGVVKVFFCELSALVGWAGVALGGILIACGMES